MYPKIRHATPIQPARLLVEFDNGVRKLYDVTPLLQREDFQSLQDWALFRLVSLEPGGYAVAWNADLDISEYELWRNGADA